MTGHPWRAIYVWIFTVGALSVWNYELNWFSTESYLRNYGTKAALSVLILGGVTFYAIEALRRSGFRDGVRRLLGWAGRTWKPLVAVTVGLFLVCLLVLLLVRGDRRQTGRFSSRDIDVFEDLLRQAPPARPASKPAASEWDVVSSKPLVETSPQTVPLCVSPDEFLKEDTSRPKDDPSRYLYLSPLPPELKPPAPATQGGR